MRLKNILIVVSDIERSKRFYRDLFGLQVIRDFGDNVILSEGLVLQGQENWEKLTELNTVIGNASELFFCLGIQGNGPGDHFIGEENDLGAFLLSVDKYPEKIEIVGDVHENSWGKRVVMMKDPDGHLIEVAEGAKGPVDL